MQRFTHINLHISCTSSPTCFFIIIFFHAEAHSHTYSYIFLMPRLTHMHLHTFSSFTESLIYISSCISSCWNSLAYILIHFPHVEAYSYAFSYISLTLKHIHLLHSPFHICAFVHSSHSHSSRNPLYISFTFCLMGFPPVNPQPHIFSHDIHSQFHASWLSYTIIYFFL